MSFIPTFGMIPVVATSYQFWYEYHTSVFAVHFQIASGGTVVFLALMISLVALGFYCTSKKIVDDMMKLVNNNETLIIKTV